VHPTYLISRYPPLTQQPDSTNIIACKPPTCVHRTRPHTLPLPKRGPIYNVPVEILIRIFQLVAPPCTRNGLYDLSKLTHVCRFWREALMNQPRLWSAVFITQKDRRSFVEACLERSHPVTLEVTVVAKSWAKSTRIVHVIRNPSKGCCPTILTPASGTSNLNSSLKPNTLTAFVRWTSNLTTTWYLPRGKHSLCWEAVGFSPQPFPDSSPSHGRTWGRPTPIISSPPHPLFLLYAP
jgi:hypothetical protein